MQFLRPDPEQMQKISLNIFRKSAVVDYVLSNNPNAKVLERATKLAVPSKRGVLQRTIDHDSIMSYLKRNEPDLIVLAGFLWKFPEHILKVFQIKS